MYPTRKSNLVGSCRESSSQHKIVILVMNQQASNENEHDQPGMAEMALSARRTRNARSAATPGIFCDA